MVDIGTGISNLRNLINSPRKQNILLKDKDYWNQICSSMDVVQDADLAIETFLESPFPENMGAAYLWVYGLLHALYLQQDAIKNLVEALRLDKSFIEPLADIKDIREIRNMSTGHPTKQGYPKNGFSYHFISRATMHKGGFQLMSRTPANEMLFKDIDLNECIGRQQEAIKRIIKSVHEELEREEEDHRKMFQDEKLQEIFHKSLGYSVGKMYETIHGSGLPLNACLYHLEVVEESLENFKKALDQRGLWEPNTNLQHEYQELEYPLSQVKRYFEGDDTADSSAQNAHVNLFFIEKKIDELEKLAAEIDERYVGTQDNNKPNNSEALEEDEKEGEKAKGL